VGTQIATKQLKRGRAKRASFEFLGPKQQQQQETLQQQL